MSKMNKQAKKDLLKSVKSYEDMKKESEKAEMKKKALKKLKKG